MAKVSVGLNPCCSGQWSRTQLIDPISNTDLTVLILVVVDNGLVHKDNGEFTVALTGLNPCCSGQWSRTWYSSWLNILCLTSLNPCCSGQWSRTNTRRNSAVKYLVLILVVVDNGLVHQ